MDFILRSALKDLRRLRRDPLGLLLWVAIPLVVGLLLNLAFGGEGAVPRAHLLVDDRDGTFVSTLLVGAFGSGRLSDLIDMEVVEAEEGRRRIEDGDASALLVIPDGFGSAVLAERAIELSLVTNPAQRVLPGIVRESLEAMLEAVFYAQRLLREPLTRVRGVASAGAGTVPDSTVAGVSVAINSLVERVQPYLFPPAIELVEEPAAAEAPERGFAELFFPGMVLLALLFTARGLSGDVWRERALGTLRRAAAAPQPLPALLAGKLLAGAAVMAMVSVTALAAGRWGFGIELHALPLAALWAALAGTTMLAVFLVLQLHASSERGGDMLTSAVLFPLAMAGGSFFPFEVMPEWLARIGRLTPNGWALTRLSDVLAGEARVDRLGAALAALLVAGGVAFALGARRLRPFARG